MKFFLKEHSYFHPSVFSRKESTQVVLLKESDQIGFSGLLTYFHEIFLRIEEMSQHKKQEFSFKVQKEFDPIVTPFPNLFDFYLFSFSFSGWTLGEGIVVHDQNDDNVDVEKMSVVEGMIKSDLTGGSTAQAHKN